MSISYERLGDLAVAAGDAVGARGLFEQGLAIRRRLALSDEGNVGFQRDLSISYGRLAQLALASGDRGEARVLWSRAASVVQRLIEIDPENVRYGNDLAYYRARLAEFDESERGVAADPKPSSPQAQAEPVPRPRGLLRRLFGR